MSLFKKNIPDESLTHSQTPTLNSVGKNNPFQVPEGYFESFENQIMNQVKFVKPAGTVETILKNIGNSLLQPHIAAAASLVIIVVSATILYFSQLGIEVPFKSPIQDVTPQTIVYVNDKLPDDKPIKTTFEQSLNNNKLIIEISPSVTPDDIQAINIINIPYTPAIQHIEKNITSYFAELEKEQEYFENVTKQTPSYQNTENSSQYQPYQYNNYTYNPFTNTPPYNPPTTSSSNNSSDNKKPVVNSNNDVNNINKPQNTSLPHFALPEFVCSETDYELMPYEKNPNFKYVWSTGERTPSIVVRSSGTYTLTIYDSENPKDFVTSTSNVRIVPKPVKSLPSHAILCSNSSLKLEPEIRNPELYSYFWIPTYDTIKDISVKNQGMYVLSITGCNTYFDSVLVTREHCDIMIPNIITPNNDGVNDYFHIHGIEKYPKTQLTIYDRSGSIIFTSSDYTNNWTGDQTPNGTYFYILRFQDGIEKHGALTILK